MAVVMRLSRGGSKKRPYYRIVVADERAPRDGKYIEKIGNYDPRLAKDNPDRIKLDKERSAHWLAVGAQPSDRVARFLDAAGVKERTPRNNPKKGEPGEKARELLEERAAKIAAAEEAAREAEEAAKAAAAEAAAAEEQPAVESEAAEAPAADEAAPAEEAAAEEAAPAEEAPAAEEAASEAPSEEQVEG